MIDSCFNPCFRGSRPRTAQPERGGHRILQVSILVFVEVALGQQRVMTAIAGSASFNPCFRGSRPRTELPGLHSPTRSRFNPCFRGSRPRTVWKTTTIWIVF